MEKISDRPESYGRFSATTVREGVVLIRPVAFQTQAFEPHAAPGGYAGSPTDPIAGKPVLPGCAAMVWSRTPWPVRCSKSAA